MSTALAVYRLQFSPQAPDAGDGRPGRRVGQVAGKDE